MIRHPPSAEQRRHFSPPPRHPLHHLQRPPGCTGPQKRKPWGNPWTDRLSTGNRYDIDGSHLTDCHAPACLLESNTAALGTLPNAVLLSPCRAAILERKRREYRDMVPDYYDIADRSADELGALRQVPRAGGCLGVKMPG